MLEKFNGIFYLIIYLVHFIGVGVYAFQTIFSTKSFMERFGIDPSGAITVSYTHLTLPTKSTL